MLLVSVYENDNPLISLGWRSFYVQVQPTCNLNMVLKDYTVYKTKLFLFCLMYHFQQRLQSFYMFYFYKFTKFCIQWYSFTFW